MSLLGRQYLVIGMLMQPVGRHYFRLVPIDSILAPTRQLFVALVSMVLMIGLLIVMSALQEANVEGRSPGKQYELQLFQGKRWFELSVARKLSNNDESPHFIVLSRDITQRKLSEADLQIAATAFESQDGMMITSSENLILKVNKAFSIVSGYSAEEVIGKNSRLLSSGKQDAVFYATMWDSINNTGAWAGEIWNRRKSGEVYPEHLTINAVKDQDGVITNYVATLTDITLRKSAAEEIQNLAFYDPLTCLPNWRLLLDRLKQALTSSTRSGRQGALLFLDLDSFKTLNDSFGHDVGDLLLQQVSERLTSCVREGDTVHAWAVTSLCCWRV